MADNSFFQQIRRNSVALISLVVALSGLGYNTWRNELTEQNRNLRVAAFEVLLKLGELQQVTFHGHYDRDDARGNPRTGWAYVLTIRDLSAILPVPVQGKAEALRGVWSEHWQELGREQASADAIVTAIEDSREVTLELLRSLE